MAALGSSRDEFATSFLERALKRLHIRSPSPSLSQSPSLPSNSRAKPLPRPPKLSSTHAEDRAQQAASLPSYGYGAEPSPYTSQPTHPHLQHKPGPARNVLSHQHVDTSQLPPRPSTFVPQHVPPPSLRPGSIPVGTLSAHKVAFPFELVPQSKERTSTSETLASFIRGTETLSHDIESSPVPKTPPRPRNRAPTSSPKDGGSLTPKGSQTDARHPPAKGQCWGIKKDGSRCTRKVRAADAGGGNSDIEEVYCFQHVAEAKKWPGFYHSAQNDSSVSGSETYVKYNDWLDDRINDHTQALLRHCMSRSLTDTDGIEQGHLYVHELMALSTPTHVCLKVGRSTQVFRRIGEWNSQCRSKQPLLRAIYPSNDDQQLMPGMDSPTMEGVCFSRRWEALVHLELSALGKRVDSICPDCGKRHREIFLIPRWLGYRDASRQDQLGGFEMVKTAILKWLRFVQMLAAPNATATASVLGQVR